MTYKIIVIQDKEYIELECDQCHTKERQAFDDAGKFILLCDGWVVSGKDHLCLNCRIKLNRKP